MENTVKNFNLHQGLSSIQTIDELSDDGKHSLIILDDLMDVVVNDSEMCKLFTQGCHHKMFSVIFLTQNSFPKGKCSWTISLNTSYIVFFKCSGHITN